MGTNGIIEFCNENGLPDSKISVVDIDVLQDKLTDEHYAKLIKIKEHDSNLSLAIAEFDERIFNKLILLELDETRPLTANGRSIGEVGIYMQSLNVKSEALFNGSGLLDKKWAENVKKYYSAFDYEKLGYLLVTVPLNNELERTRNGCFYLADGNHRALALLAKVQLDGFEFKPIKVIVTYFDREGLARHGITI